MGPALKAAAQGPYHADGRYVTITNGHYTIWANFNWRKKQTTQKLVNQTFLAKGHYNHRNGTYYSLYDDRDRWHGYVNVEAATTGAGEQGAWLQANQYVTMTNATYPLWPGFFSGRRAASLQTYHVTGVYHALDGSVYDSLYDGHDRSKQTP